MNIIAQVVTGVKKNNKIYQETFKGDSKYDKIYLGVTEISWKKRFYGHKTS